MIEEIKKVENDLKDCAEAINKNYTNIQFYGKPYIRNLIVLRELNVLKTFPGTAKEYLTMLRRRMNEGFEGEFSEIVTVARKEAMQRIEGILQNQTYENINFQSDQTVPPEQEQANSCYLTKP